MKNSSFFLAKVFQRNKDFEINSLAISEKISDVKTLRATIPSLLTISDVCPLFIEAEFSLKLKVEVVPEPPCNVKFRYIYLMLRILNYVFQNIYTI